MRMDRKHLRSFIDKKFNIPVIEGESKVCSLAEAMRKNVREGMSIHAAGRTGALNYQLVREFWGKKPGFTFISYAVSGTLLSLIQGRLIKKAITSFAGNGYPSPAPNPLVQQAYISKAVEFENWTMLTIPLRLLAGAMGWDAIPTRSILGSSMEKENRESFLAVPSPFVNGGTIGLMKALKPDVTLLHGAVADPCGNTIMTYPLGNDVFGAWAAKEGVVVSVDKIVTTEYIRKYAHLVRIPSYMVLAVCEAPYGAHPTGVTCNGLPEFEAYADDYDFFYDVTMASNDEGKFAEWIQYWILDCKGHDEYIEKLGKSRLNYLKGRAKPGVWEDELSSITPGIDTVKPANPLERMVITAARVVADRSMACGHKTIMAGLGNSNLAAWLATYMLKERGYDVDLMAEIGMYGYLPRASDPFIFSFHNMPTAKILTNVEMALGVFAGGSANRCIGVLGAAQVDRFGNANLTKIPDKFYLVGSGGANDIASTNSETVVVVASGKERLVNEVPYITYTGDNVRVVVSDVGIFEKASDSKTLILTGYVPFDPNQKEAEAIADIRGRVGWELNIATNLKRIPLPTEEELTLLRLFDPRGYFVGM